MILWEKSDIYRNQIRQLLQRVRAAMLGYSLVLQLLRSVGVVKIRVEEMFVRVRLGEYK